MREYESEGLALKVLYFESRKISNSVLEVTKSSKSEGLPIK